MVAGWGSLVTRRAHKLLGNPEIGGQWLKVQITEAISLSVRVHPPLPQ